MHTRPLLLVIPLLLVLAGCGESDSAPADVDAGEDASETEYLQEGDLVHGLDITAVSIYQGVKIPLMDDWVDETSYPVPIVQNREAMVRVHVKRQTQWQPHDIVAQLDVESDLVETAPIKWVTAVEQDSAEYNLDSTLNLPVPGKYIAADSRITVSLREWSGGVEPKGTADKAIWPVEGSYELGALDNGAPLQLVLVPVYYWADGSGRSPDTSPPQVQRFVDSIHSQYPTRGVQVTVLDPIDWYEPIVYNGAGWVEVLTEIMQVRASTGASTEDYYYGLFQPASTFGEYCVAACVAGMSNLALNPGDFWARSSVGVGYPGQDSANTMVHEVGHAHGREHTPCGVSGPTDPFYPYPGAFIGSWGYDMENEEIKDPSLNYDFMSYCDPTWVSDYTYNALYGRIMAVNNLASKKGPAGPTEPWLTIRVGLDGIPSAGPVLWLDEPPMSRDVALELVGDDDELVQVTHGYFQPFSMPPAGMLIFPEPAAAFAQVRLPQGELVPFGI